MSQGFESWHDGKLFVERLTTISHDALHILAGTAVWLFCAIIFRRPLTSWLPLAATFVVVLINEAVDLWVEIWPEHGMQAGEAAKDILTTIAVPALLCVALRTVPRLGGPAAGRRRR